MKALPCGVLGAVCSCFAVTARAEAITLAPGETMEKSVAAGETSVQDGRVFVSTEANLYKTGAGEWQMPLSQIDQPQPLRIQVLNGSLSLPSTGGTALPTTYALPVAIKDKVFAWIDASDTNAAHFAGTTGGQGEAFVDTWYDVRETSTTTPTHPYYKHNATYSSAAPQKVTTNGFQAIWFGGYGSGRCYHWMNSKGTHYDPGGANAARHVFAVHGVLESFGHIFGSTNGSASTYVAHWDVDTKAATLASTYWWNSEWSDMVNGRTYVNGERVDGTHERVRKGFQLLEANAGDIEIGYTTALYSKGGDKKHAGGDFLCEALVFRTVLSESERRAVQDYLMHKWFGKGSPQIQVDVARSATVKLDAERASYDLAGEGTALKTGSTDFVRPFGADALFDGTLDLNGGTMKMGSQIAVKAQAGDRISAVRTHTGADVTTASDAAADALVKDGDGASIINGVPAGVKTLDVRGGSLTVRAPLSAATATSSEAVEVFIENHDFEDVTAEELPGGVRNLPTAPSLHGWTQIDGNTSFVYDYYTWTGKVSGHADGASKTDWNMDVAVPPMGSKALVVRSYGKCYTTVTIPVAGVYELSYQAMMRTQHMGVGNRVEISLTDAAGKKIAAFDDVLRRVVTPSGYRKYATRAYVSAAGTYRLRLEGTDGGSAVSFDDLHLRRIVDEKGAMWKIPNGGFTQGTMTAATSGIFTNANTATGWTFTDPVGWVDPAKKGRPAVGLTLLSMGGYYRTGGYFNNSRGDRYDTEMLIRGKGGAAGAQATTTFTPAAGTWYLEATVAAYGTYAAGLVAQAIVGNVTNDLGTVTPADKLMTLRRWPKPLTVTGSEAVTLRLTLDTGSDNSRGVSADDFCLSATPPPADSRVEYIKNGGFESDGAYWAGIADASAQQSGHWMGRNYHEAHWAFGWDSSDGSKFATFYKLGGAVQTVTLPAGRFRLSCQVKGRTSTGETGYIPHPMDVFVAKDGVTNFIGRTEGSTTALWATNHVRHVFDFTIPEAGTYAVGFRGRWDAAAYPNNSETHLDDVSLRAVSSSRDRTPPFAADAVVKVAPGALLMLDFDGTNKVERIRLGGRTVIGDISAKTHPEYIVGSGVLHADPHGMTILLR